MPRPSDALKAYREKKGLSQKDVADKLEISRAMVGLLENGDRPYTAAMCVLIEGRLGIERSRLRPDLFAKAA